MWKVNRDMEIQEGKAAYNAEMARRKRGSKPSKPRARTLSPSSRKRSWKDLATAFTKSSSLVDRLLPKLEKDLSKAKKLKESSGLASCAKALLGRCSDRDYTPPTWFQTWLIETAPGFMNTDKAVWEKRRILKTGRKSK